MRTLITLFLGLLVFDFSAAAATDRISVTVRGKGPDVILIPGLACSSAVWDAAAGHLEGSYRLHIVQVAGFGGTPAAGNAEGAVVQPTVDAIDAYIKANKLNAPKVIGHSLGGLMGLMLVIEHPEDVGGLMIVDALPFGGALFGATDVGSATPQAAAMRDMIIGETQDAYAQGEAGFLRSLVKSPDGLKAVTGWAVGSDKSVVARALYEDMTTDMRPRLHEIKTPVTMLYPWDASMGMPQAAVDGMYRQNFAALAGVKMVRIDGSYHFVMLDQPDLFAAQLDGFLQSSAK
jgi:pimeloyl-ACP methyl ester carboxylesterase